MVGRGVLFLCVANSARSQMAESIARSLAPVGVPIHSAGSHPGRVHPLALRSLEEIGLDASTHGSKGIGEVPMDDIGMVVTLCADEVCPVLPPGVEHLHWPLPDPEGIESFRAARDELTRRITDLFGS